MSPVLSLHASFLKENVKGPANSYRKLFISYGKPREKEREERGKERQREKETHMDSGPHPQNAGGGKRGTGCWSGDGNIHLTME